MKSFFFSPRKWKPDKILSWLNPLWQKVFSGCHHCSNVKKTVFCTTAMMTMYYRDTIKERWYRDSSTLTSESSIIIQRYKILETQCCWCSWLIQQHEDPVLFSIYGDVLDEGTECPLSQFANNMKVGGSADLLDFRKGLQKDLDGLDQWPEDNSVRITKNKCWPLHLGHNNHRQSYGLGE